MSASISPIIQNKDDSVESSFCYKLFEERYFDVGRMEELVCYVQSSDMNTEEIDILACIGYWGCSFQIYIRDNEEYCIDNKYKTHTSQYGSALFF